MIFGFRSLEKVAMPCAGSTHRLKLTGPRTSLGPGPRSTHSQRRGNFSELRNLAPNMLKSFARSQKRATDGAEF